MDQVKSVMWSRRPWNGGAAGVAMVAAGIFLGSILTASHYVLVWFAVAVMEALLIAAVGFQRSIRQDSLSTTIVVLPLGLLAGELLLGTVDWLLVSYRMGSVVPVGLGFISGTMLFSLWLWAPATVAYVVGYILGRRSQSPL